MNRPPCYIEVSGYNTPSERYLAEVDRIDATGEFPEEAAKLLAEQLERRAEAIRIWVAQGMKSNP